MPDIYLQSIELTNLGGFEKFRADFDEKGTLILGENGAGKTSIIKGIAMFFDGGADYDLIRNGQQSGSATITFSDGSRAWKALHLPESPDDKPSYELKAWGPEGEVKKSPATWLGERVPKSTFDPFAFLRSEPKNRAEFLLKHLPMVFDASEVNAAQDPPVAKYANLAFPVIHGPVSLERLNEIRDTRYEERRQVNVQQRDLEGVISDLQKSLPPQAEGVDWASERDGIEAEIRKTEGLIASVEAEIKLEAEQARTRQKALVQGQIDALQRKLADDLATINTAEAESISEQTRALQETRAALSVGLGTAKANAERETEATGIRKAVEARELAAKGLISKEMRLSAVIKSLDELKNNRLREIPIEGFDLKKDGRGRPIITINGISLDQLNAQQQLFVAVQCIQLGSGNLPIILAESGELDDPHMEELVSACRQAGIQLIAARWKNNTALELKAA